MIEQRMPGYWLGASLCMIMVAIFEMGVAEIIEVCNAEDAEVSCPASHIIVVNSAEFGRMEVGRCIKKEDQFLGCSNDVLPLLDQWCSCRQECSFEVTNEDLDSANRNCLEILIKYLRVEYSCLKVKSNCRSSQSNILVDKNGYISSYAMDRKGCGSSRLPWIITSDPGQTITLDMIDFASGSQTYNMISCRIVYGFVVEKSLGINHTICAGSERQSELYQSKSNSIEIYFLPRERTKDAKFLLHYRAVGCSEVIPPAHAWYKREGNHAIIGCDNTDKEWQLTCVDNRWIGEMGNCSKIAVVLREDQPEHTWIEISSVVVISGIAGAAVVLSVIAVVCGVVYINKYRMKQEMKRANLYKTYSTIGSNTQAYYRPVTGDQSENSAACWDMSLLTNNQMTLLSDKCTCPTLQMRNTGEVDRTEGDRSLERQSLYSSIRST